MDVALTITKDVPTKYPTTAAISEEDDRRLICVQVHPGLEEVLQLQLNPSREQHRAVLRSPTPRPTIVP